MSDARAVGPLGRAALQQLIAKWKEREWVQMLSCEREYGHTDHESYGAGEYIGCAAGYALCCRDLEAELERADDLAAVIARLPQRQHESEVEEHEREVAARRDMRGGAIDNPPHRAVGDRSTGSA